MSNVIYVDVLILINMFVTYFLVLSTSKLLCVRVKRLRYIFVTVLGGVYSLIIFLYLSFAELFIIKLLMGATLVLTAYGFKSVKLFIKSVLTFLVVNFVYGGLMFAVWYFINPAIMQYKNGVVYFNISALALAVTTLVAYAVIELFNFIFKKRSAVEQFYEIEIGCDGKNALLNGFMDTGNKLVDIFTGLPVVICDFNLIKEIIPQNMHSFFKSTQEIDFDSGYGKWSKKVRIIPVASVTGHSTLPAFKPDTFKIKLGKTAVEKEVIIAVSSLAQANSQYQAILTESII